ncbi:hypothetical protein [Sorangium sp. So ce693]|uniref:hypothetical protein n=1 Tax=Sorangium sp. So ce693 TaxID=3133318 RepID=UPI003F6048E3
MKSLLFGAPGYRAGRAPATASCLLARPSSARARALVITRSGRLPVVAAFASSALAPSRPRALAGGAPRRG